MTKANFIIFMYVAFFIAPILLAIIVEVMPGLRRKIPERHLTWSSWLKKHPHIIDPIDGSAWVIDHATHVTIPVLSFCGGLAIGSLLMGNLTMYYMRAEMSEIVVKVLLSTSCAISLWIMFARTSSLHRCASVEDVPRKYQNTVDDVERSNI
jgi:hypothetical protein